MDEEILALHKQDIAISKRDNESNINITSNTISLYIS